MITGVNCEIVPDMCLSVPCKNGGTCTSGFNPDKQDLEFNTLRPRGTFYAFHIEKALKVTKIK